MSDEEIERAIQDAKDYAEEDEFRRASVWDVRQKANDLLNECNQALATLGKQLDKYEKRQIKADMAELQRVLARRPSKKEKMDPEAEARNIVVAAARLDQSSTHAREMAKNQAGSKPVSALAKNQVNNSPVSNSALLQVNRRTQATRSATVRLRLTMRNTPPLHFSV